MTDWIAHANTQSLRRQIQFLFCLVFGALLWVLGGCFEERDGADAVGGDAVPDQVASDDSRSRHGPAEASSLVVKVPGGARLQLPRRCVRSVAVETVATIRRDVPGGPMDSIREVAVNVDMNPHLLKAMNPGWLRFGRGDHISVVTGTFHVSVNIVIQSVALELCDTEVVRAHGKVLVGGDYVYTGGPVTQAPAYHTIWSPGAVHNAFIRAEGVVLVPASLDPELRSVFEGALADSGMLCVLSDADFWAIAAVVVPGRSIIEVKLSDATSTTK